MPAASVRASKLDSPPAGLLLTGTPENGGFLGQVHTVSGSKEQVVCIVPVEATQELPVSVAKPDVDKMQSFFLSTEAAYVERDGASVPHSVWLVLPRFSGGVLSEVVDEVKERSSFLQGSPHVLNETATIYVLQQLLKAVDFLHQRNQVHNHVCLHSIYLSSSGSIKLVSPALARFYSSVTLGRKDVAYMPPEVLKNPRTGSRPAADIWSVGMVALALVQGGLPFDEKQSQPALLQAVASPNLTRTDASVSSSLKDFVITCLQRDAGDRPTAKQLLHHRVFRSVNEAAGKRELRDCIGFRAITDAQQVPRGGSEVSLASTLAGMTPQTSPTKPGRGAGAGEQQRAPDNLVTLAVLDERSVLLALEQRYAADQVYTHVGEMVIAVNPLKQLPIYSPSTAAAFGFDSPPNNTPHIFGVAQAAFKGLLHTKKDQVCLITGESGAGKTENSKYFLHQLLGAESRNAQLILKTTPLLEAFGNAKTVHNSNSSRFGKYLEILYDPKLNVVGARLSKYLLEQSRVVAQATNETNFHVFEYLMAGTTASVKADLHLDDPVGYAYLGQTAHRRTSSQSHFSQAAVRPVTSLRDLDATTENARAYQELIDVLLDLEFERAEISGIHVLLAIVLNIGNIDFVVEAGNTELEAEVFDMGPVANAADLLGVDADELAETFVSNVIETAGETFVRRNTVVKAVDSRDAMAKALYGRLFSWIVERISMTLASSSRQHQHSLHRIGVLDIFGFECMENNSLEQLFINIANEELQHYFNQFIFTWELDEYKREGVHAHNVEFTNNKAQLDLLLGHPIGVLSLLNEESRFPRGSDETFVAKLREHLSKRPMFHPSPTTHDLRFAITHYAATISYDARGFLEKNRDTLSHSVVELLRHSEVELVQTLFDPSASISSTGSFRLADHRSNAPKYSFYQKSQRRKSRKSRRGKRTKGSAIPSIGATFKASLKELMSRVQKCTPHFVRCIKPNNAQRPNQFEREAVLKQLRYAGVMEATRIRQLGYPGRHTFAEFVALYQIIGYNLTDKVPPTRESCEYILSRAEERDTRFGHSKVFLKFGQINRLTAILDMFHKSAATIQRASRCWSARRKLAYLRWQLAERMERKRKAEEERRRKEAAERAARDREAEVKRQEAERMLLAELQQSQQVASGTVAASSRRKPAAAACVAATAGAAAAAASSSSSSSSFSVPPSSLSSSSTRPARAVPTLPFMPVYTPTTIRSDDAFRQLVEKRRRECQEALPKLHGTHPVLLCGTNPRYADRGLQRAAAACGPLQRAKFIAMETRIVTEESLIVGARDLNRYRNILPTVATRVLLKEPMDLELIGPPPEHPTNGVTPPDVLERNRRHYVNANRVRGMDLDDSWYIAAQGPSVKSVHAFWRMVWEQDVPAIVMVTGLIERGKEKCYRYWPTELYNAEDDVGHLTFGDISVHVIHGTKKDQYVATELVLRRGDEVKQVCHFWFVGWPDHGVPNRPEGVLSFRHAVYNRVGQTSRPVVVHCSAGVGRTGTFIAIDMGIRQLLSDGRADALQIIAQMREDRGAAVQTDQQYALIYNALLSFALDLSLVGGTVLSVVPNDVDLLPEADYSDEDTDDEELYGSSSESDDSDVDEETQNMIDVFQYYAVLSRRASKVATLNKKKEAAQSSVFNAAQVDSVSKSSSLPKTAKPKVSEAERQRLAGLAYEQMARIEEEGPDEGEAVSDADAASDKKPEPRQKTGYPLTERQLALRAAEDQARKEERDAILLKIEDLEREVQQLRKGVRQSVISKTSVASSSSGDLTFPEIIDQLRFLNDQVAHREMDLPTYLNLRQKMLDKGEQHLHTQHAAGAMASGERELKHQQLVAAGKYDEDRLNRRSLTDSPRSGRLLDKVIAPSPTVSPVPSAASTSVLASADATHGTFVVKQVDDESDAPPPFVNRATKPAQQSRQRLDEFEAERRAAARTNGNRVSMMPIEMDADEPPPFVDQAPLDGFEMRHTVPASDSFDDRDDSFADETTPAATPVPDVPTSSLPPWEPFARGWLRSSDFYTHRVPKRTSYGRPIWGTMQYIEKGQELTRFSIAVPECVFTARRMQQQSVHFAVGLLPNRLKENKIVNTRKGIGDGLTFSIDDKGTVWMSNSSRKPVHDYEGIEAIPTDVPLKFFDIEVIRAQVQQLLRSGASKRHLKAALALTTRTLYFGHEDERALRRGHTPRVQLLFKFEAAAIEVLRAFSNAKSPVQTCEIPAYEETEQVQSSNTASKRKYPKGSVSDLIPLAL
eukprot:m.117396 g.117396  ORF g.117396 m.117396 type:complete len:2248 (+) comp16399_c0_seq1:446-7189(+)